MVGTYLMPLENAKKHVHNASYQHEGDLRAGIKLSEEGSLTPGSSFTNLLEIYRLKGNNMDSKYTSIIED